MVATFLQKIGTNTTTNNFYGHKDLIQSLSHKEVFNNDNSIIFITAGPQKFL